MPSKQTQTIRSEDSRRAITHTKQGAAVSEPLQLNKTAETAPKTTHTNNK